METNIKHKKTNKILSYHCIALITLIAVSLLPTALFAKQQTDTQLNQLRFKEQMWDAQVLRIFLEGPKYLKPELEFNLPKPPLNNSQTSRNELQTLLKYQSSNRDKSTISKIIKEAKSGDFVKNFLNDKAISTKLANASYNALTLANDECQYFVVKYKKRFARPRPSALIAALYPEADKSKKLILVVPNPGHAAYPSGHATQSMLMSKILGLIDPKNKSVYETYARDIAVRREFAGVHYPSDSATGQKLARALLKELMKAPAFNKELQTAKIRFQKPEK